MSDAEHPTSSHVSLLLPPKDLLEDGLVARRPWQACVAPQRRVVLQGDGWPRPPRGAQTHRGGLEASAAAGGGGALGLVALVALVVP